MSEQAGAPPAGPWAGWSVEKARYILSDARTSRGWPDRMMPDRVVDLAKGLQYTLEQLTEVQQQAAAWAEERAALEQRAETARAWARRWKAAAHSYRRNWRWAIREGNRNSAFLRVRWEQAEAERNTLRARLAEADLALAYVEGELTNHADDKGWFYNDCRQDCLDRIRTAHPPTTAGSGAIGKAQE